MSKKTTELIKHVRKARGRVSPSQATPVGDKLIWIIQGGLSENAFEIHLATRMLVQKLDTVTRRRYHLVRGDDILSLVLEHDDRLAVDSDDLDDDDAVHDYLSEYFYVSSSEGTYDERRYYVYHFSKDDQVHFTLLDLPTLVDIYQSVLVPSGDNRA